MGKRINEIEAVLTRLANGKINNPVTEAECKDPVMVEKLERLRWELIKAKDKEYEMQRKNREAIAAVAHDLKTPISVIAGYTEALSDGLGKEEYYQKILENTSSMNEMVLSLMEAETAANETSHRERVETKELFWGLLKKFEPLVLEANIKFKVSRIPKAYVRVNTKDIERVLQNLITNAVRYCRRGGKIEISFYMRRSKFYVKVEDNGQGMSPDIAAKVFDRFYREDESRSKSHFGLGLAIAKNIVEDHGGKIKVSSRQGKGSAFIFYLPIEYTPYERKRFLSEKFDDLKRRPKVIIMLIFGWIHCWLYRFSKYGLTKTPTTLFGAFISCILFPFFWIIDLFDVLITGEITYLCD